MAVPLDAQITEVEKTIRDRVRRYSYMIERGSLRQETADAKLAAMRHVQTTLTWLNKNMDWIKAEAEARRDVLKHPAVAAVKAEFPDAEVQSIGPLETEKA